MIRKPSGNWWPHFLHFYSRFISHKLQRKETRAEFKQTRIQLPIQPLPVVRICLNNLISLKHWIFIYLIVSITSDVAVRSFSHVWLFAIPWTVACQASVLTVSCSLLKLMSIELVMPSNHLILPFSFCLQSFPESGSFLMSHLYILRCPKYWSFSFSISPSNAYSGLIIL